MKFSILIFDEPNTTALRGEYRARHLDYLEAFDDQTIFTVPSISDDESVDLGSLQLIEFPERMAAEQHVLDDPYVLGGVQIRWSINLWQASIPCTWLDCPRTEVNIQVLVHGLDAPAGAEVRSANSDAHESYCEEHRNSVMCRGPMSSDDVTTALGDVVLLDVPDMATEPRMMENDLYLQGGVLPGQNAPSMALWTRLRAFQGQAPSCCTRRC